MISVLLPLYKMQSITWLAMESLCRQQNAPPWELIICAEQDETAPDAFFLEYAPRLKAAGMVDLHIIRIEKRLELSLKWRKMAKQTHANSEVCILQAGDCYSGPNRLATAYQHKHFDWQQYREGHFYHIGQKHLCLFRADLSRHLCGLDMAAKTSLMRKLPDEGLGITVDNWLRRSLDKMKRGNLKVKWHGQKQGLDSHGHNNISKPRGNMLLEHQPPFYPSQQSLSNLLPPPVAEKLQAMA